MEFFGFMVWWIERKWPPEGVVLLSVALLEEVYHCGGRALRSRAHSNHTQCFRPLPIACEIKNSQLPLQEAH